MLIIAPITSAVGKIYPFEILLATGQGTAGGLYNDSKIMLDKMCSVDKRRLIKRICMVDHEILMRACTIAQKLINAPSAGKL